MNYYDQIINLSCVPLSSFNLATNHAYKLGYDSARQIAAEIASSADAAIVGLECDNENLQRLQAVLTGDNAKLRAELELVRVEKQATLKRMQELEEVLGEILDCPHGLDSASIPRGGIAVNPAQVIVAFSVGLPKVNRMRALLALPQIVR